MTSWTGSTAVITGGAQGIGLGIAREAAARGARLALLDLDAEALDHARAELSEVTPTLTFVHDVRDRPGFVAIADQVESELGPVDKLFNNAGVAPIVSTATLTYEQWDWALDINLVGVVNGIQTFVPRMIARGEGGYVVNTASGAGLVGSHGVLYATTKFAVVGLSESLRLDLEPHRIDVSVLCPGPVDTGIVGNSMSLQGFDADNEMVREAAAGASTFLATGRSIDEVGRMVGAGMDERATWIHTDALIGPALEQRHAALMASLGAIPA